MGRLMMWNLMSLEGSVEGPNRGGTPLFKPGTRLRLKLIDTRPLSSGVVINSYTPVR